MAHGYTDRSESGRITARTWPARHARNLASTWRRQGFGAIDADADTAKVR
jgi:hypothetical protein